jgi:hypothetical protein
MNVRKWEKQEAEKGQEQDEEGKEEKDVHPYQ